MINIVFVTKPITKYHIHGDDWKEIDSVNGLNSHQTLGQSKNIVVTYSEDQLQEVLDKECNVFIPANLVRSDYSGYYDNLYTYFELESYPFFEKLKDIIKKDQSKKGVFRFRRKLSEKEGKTINSDLYVFNTVFGEMQNVEITHSDRDYESMHVILLVKYNSGALAHLEYTFTNEDNIEFDWSGFRRIIEFNGNEMNPVKPNPSFSLSLYIDAILSKANPLTKDLVAKLNNYNQLVGGDI